MTSSFSVRPSTNNDKTIHAPKNRLLCFLRRLRCWNVYNKMLQMYCCCKNHHLLCGLLRRKHHNRWQQTKSAFNLGWVSYLILIWHSQTGGGAGQHPCQVLSDSTLHLLLMHPQCSLHITILTWILTIFSPLWLYLYLYCNQTIRTFTQ